MKSIDIAIKDLKRAFRSAILLVFMFVIPLLVSTLFYFMFGNINQEGGFNLPRTKVVVANLDTNAPRLQAGSGRTPGGIKADTLSELIVNVLESKDLADLLQVSRAVDAAAARFAVDQQQAQVALIIPKDFSRQFADLNGESSIEFYSDPTLTIGPSIVKSILNQFMDSIAGIKITVNTAMDQLPEEQYGLIGGIVQQYLDDSTTQTRDLRGTVLDVHTPVKPGAAAKAEEKRNSLASILGPFMGGMMIFFAFYTGTASAESILREEEERTLPRLFTTPTPQSTILTGKFMAVFLTVIVQIIVLIIAGRLLFQIRWGNILPLTLVIVGTVILASCFGIFVNSMLKDTKQGAVVFGGVLTVTGMLGMISVFSMNSPTARITSLVSLAVPQGWAIRGLLQSISEAAMQDVLLTVGMMLLWAAIFFALGVWRFNKRYA